MSRKSSAEVEKLFDIAAKFKNILECKRSDCVTTKNKDDAWIKIATEFNASNDILREAKELKKNFTNVRYATKSKATEIRRSVYGTGGGPATACAMAPVEERMLSMLTEAETNGVHCSCDSDTQILRNEVRNEDPAPAVETPDNDSRNELPSLENPMPGPSTLRARPSTPLRTFGRKNKATHWEKLADIKSKWCEAKLKEEMAVMKKVQEKVDLEMELMRKKHELQVEQMKEKHEIEVKILLEKLERERLEVLKIKNNSPHT